MRNVLDKVPESYKQEVKSFLIAVRDAPDYSAGVLRAKEFVGKYEKQFPRTVNSFSDDFDATLNHLKLPVIHHKFVRTTNLIERSFGEEKRRSKVIPRFFDEKSALKLAFATLWRTSQRWRKVRFTEVEQRIIFELQKKLNLETDAKSKEEDVNAA